MGHFFKEMYQNHFKIVIKIKLIMFKIKVKNREKWGFQIKNVLNI